MYQFIEVTYAKGVRGTLNPYLYLIGGRVAFEKFVIRGIISTWIVLCQNMFQSSKKLLLERRETSEISNS